MNVRPLEVEHESGSTPLGTPGQRALLARLLLDSTGPSRSSGSSKHALREAQELAARPLGQSA